MNYLSASLLAVILFWTAATGQTKKRNELIIKGHVNYPSGKKIWFVWYDADEKRCVDSVKVVNGTFLFKSICNGYTDRFYLKSDPNIRSNNDEVNNVQISVENAVMDLRLKAGHFSKYSLTGCATCELIKKRSDYISGKYDKKRTFYYEKVNSNSLPDSIKKYTQLYTEIDKQAEDEIIAWCKAHPDNNLSPLELTGIADKSDDAEKMESCYQKLSTFQQKSYYGQLLTKSIRSIKFRQSRTGTKAPLFTKPDPDNKDVNLEEINKNSYVLLDFWATWCVPCRASHPGLLKLYEKYASENFKVIGIAENDNDTTIWKHVIAVDSLSNWFNILNGTHSDQQTGGIVLSDLFYIKSLPTKILIDPSGTIVGRYESLDELEKQLKLIYKF